MIIIRKPKFMRSLLGMRAYLHVAESYTHLASITNDADRRYEYLCASGELINKAAKAGGFFTVKDMIRWFDSKEKEA